MKHVESILCLLLEDKLGEQAKRGFINTLTCFKRDYITEADATKLDRHPAKTNQGFHRGVSPSLGGKMTQLPNAEK
jgi:hypothetical protein